MKAFFYNYLFFFFQARNVNTGELAAIKVIKLEPGKLIEV